MAASTKTATSHSLSKIGHAPPSTALRACVYIALILIPTASLAWTAGLLSQINSRVAPTSRFASATKPIFVTGSIAGDRAVLTGLLWAWVTITGAQILVGCIVATLEIAFERTQASMRFRTFEIACSAAMMLSAIFARVAIPQSIISPGQFFVGQLCKDAVMVAVSLVWQFTLPGGEIDDHLIRRDNRRLVSRPSNPAPNPCEDPISPSQSAHCEIANVPIFSFASITRPKPFYGSQARQVLVRPPTTKNHVPIIPRAPLAQPPAPVPVSLPTTSNTATQVPTEPIGSTEADWHVDPARLDTSVLSAGGANDSALVTSFNSLPRMGFKFTGIDEAVDDGCQEDWPANRVKASGHILHGDARAGCVASV